MTQPHVHVYGVDHSPWVQAVLLGLHEKGIPHTLRTIPPLAVFAKSGVMMPAASIGDAPWRLESTDILHELGYDRVSPDDLRELYAAWRGVFHRADHISWFFGNFSLCRDQSPSLPARLRNHFLRCFSVLYFYLLIRFTVLSRLQPDPENFADQFVYWEKTLREGKGPFLDGDEPGIRDMLLFGIIQCHCSVLVPPVSAMQREARLSSLRAWIGLMQGRFADYPHLYSGVYFEPHAPAPEPSTPAERNVFWLGAACMWLALPITLPVIVFLALTARRSGPNTRTGEDTTPSFGKDSG